MRYNKKVILHFGVIAQLFRAPPLQGGGPGLESLLLHHNLDGDIAQPRQRRMPSKSKIERLRLSS